MIGPLLVAGIEVVVVVEGVGLTPAAVLAVTVAVMVRVAVVTAVVVVAVVVAVTVAVVVVVVVEEGGVERRTCLRVRRRRRHVALRGGVGETTTRTADSHPSWTVTPSALAMVKVYVNFVLSPLERIK